MNKKKLFLISDGSAETVRGIGDSFIVQFDRPGVSAKRFGRVSDKDRLNLVTDEISQFPGCMVLFTIADVELRDILHHYCEDNNIFHIDIFGFFIRKFEKFIGKKAIGKSGLLHRFGDKYFDRIAAIDYTLAHDDNRSIVDIETADIVIVGLSRSGKTPLSIYLAENDGYRIANFAIVKGERYPKVLDTIQQDRIVMLKIDPEVLMEIRQNRAKKLKIDNPHYCSRSCIYEETEMMLDLERNHHQWIKIDTTGRAIEEIASEVIENLRVKSSCLVNRHNRMTR